MKVKVRFFKASGKWYADGEAEIGETMLHDSDFEVQCRKAQNAVLGTGAEFFMVTDNSDPDDPFCIRLFPPTKR